MYFNQSLQIYWENWSDQAKTKTQQTKSNLKGFRKQMGVLNQDNQMWLFWYTDLQPDIEP